MFCNDSVLQQQNMYAVAIVMEKIKKNNLGKEWIGKIQNFCNKHLIIQKVN